MNSNEKADVIIIVIKRILKWIFYFILIIVLLFFIVFCYIKINEYIDSKPKIINNFEGIEINQKLSDVLFKNAGFKKAENENPNIGDIYYENDETGNSFYASNNIVIHINHLCKKDYDYAKINGIGCNSTGEEIFNIYGTDIKIQCLKDKSDKFYIEHRVYDLVNFGVRYHLFSNKVAAFSLTTPDKLKTYTGFNWIACE